MRPFSLPETGGTALSKVRPAEYGCSLCREQAKFGVITQSDIQVSLAGDFDDLFGRAPSLHHSPASSRRVARVLARRSCPAATSARHPACESGRCPSPGRLRLVQGTAAEAERLVHRG